MIYALLYHILSLPCRKRNLNKISDKIKSPLKKRGSSSTLREITKPNPDPYQDRPRIFEWIGYDRFLQLLPQLKVIGLLNPITEFVVAHRQPEVPLALLVQKPDLTIPDRYRTGPFSRFLFSVVPSVFSSINMVADQPAAIFTG